MCCYIQSIDIGNSRPLNFCLSVTSISGDEFLLQARAYRQSTNIKKQDELTSYLKFDHRETNSNDVLEFWSTMGDSLPALTKVAFQILTIPATPANVERSFSAAGQIVYERRFNISRDLVNDILLLRSIKK